MCSTWVDDFQKFHIPRLQVVLSRVHEFIWWWDDLEFMVLKQKSQLSFCWWFEAFSCVSFHALWKKMFCSFHGTFLFILQPFAHSSSSLPYIWEDYSFFSLACHYTHMLMEVLQIVLFTKSIIYYLQSLQHNGMCLCSDNKYWASYTVLLLKFIGVLRRMQMFVAYQKQLHTSL